MNRVGADNKGFSLLEMIVCVAMLAVIALVITKGFAGAAQVQQMALRRDRANTAASNIAEQIKAGVTLDDLVDDSGDLTKNADGTYAYKFNNGTVIDGIVITVLDTVDAVTMRKPKLPSAPLIIEATADAENVSVFRDTDNVIEECTYTIMTYDEDDPESEPIPESVTSFKLHPIPTGCDAVFYVVPSISGYTVGSNITVVERNSGGSYIAYDEPVKPLGAFTVKIGDIEIKSEFYR